MNRSPLRRQAGTTLIEVLVTLIVLAIGLLGLAGLQASSIQSNQSAYYRSQATLLASDMADRMRANRSATLAGAYTFSFPASSASHAVSGTQAQKDRAEWLNRLASVLPGGTGQVERNGELVTVSVRWDDARGEIRAADASGSHETTFVYRTEI